MTLQAAYRGRIVRKEYAKVRKGVVALQAVYRMRRQQSLYGEMKSELERRRALDRDLGLGSRPRETRSGSRDSSEHGLTSQVSPSGLF